ncbi:hypothetical protein J6590_040286 [Homalodisca vitripennis]|nr:hypothetical protein J6590_040286 [Homalodisca vitripennis]
MGRAPHASPGWCDRNSRRERVETEPLVTSEMKSTERENVDCSFHYSNTQAICSWQEGSLHPLYLSAPCDHPIQVTYEELVNNGCSPCQKIG